MQGADRISGDLPVKGRAAEEGRQREKSNVWQPPTFTNGLVRILKRSPQKESGARINRISPASCSTTDQGLGAESAEC